MRIGFLQLRPKFGAVKTNVRKALNLLDRVSEATIVIPELFNTGYLFRNEEELASLAEKVPGGYTTTEMKKIAKRKNLNIIYGIAEKAGRKYYNSSVFVSSKGKVEVYRKVHLFDREKLFFTRGQSFKVVSTGEAKLGMMICFDWIFPEVSRLLMLQGADVLCHPCNLVLPYAHEAIKTRCVENGIFAIMANRIGTERRGTISLTFTGGSQVIGPKGEVLTSAGDRSESLKVVEIDVEEARNKNITPNNNIIADRVPALYKTITLKGKR
jgi:predicted amidohydrolase